MITVCLVRHGETQENVRQILQGHIDGTLTESGIAQAQLVQEKLRGQTFQMFFSSDLKRAYDTALIINKNFNLLIQKTQLLRERDWGELTGVSMKEAQALPLLPASVETVEQTCMRASSFLEDMLKRYDGKRILVVSHGFFLRCMQAVARGVSFREIPLMQNAECRFLYIDKILPPVLTDKNSTVISAN